ncbi:MAG: Maf family protein [Erysipelotrichaceae bacterium]|jgi:septum formation protein
MKKLILASKSPRRKELLELLGFDFDVVVSDVNETVSENLSIEEMVKALAYQKAIAVFETHPDNIVLGSDTVVVVDNEILGKPKNAKQAKEMMLKIKNREHQVITGVAILSKQEKIVFSNTSVVHFNDIEEKEIDKYIKTSEPYDKAGGYAIQGWAARYISSIEGNYYTIMGLPLDKVFESLNKLL